MSDAIFSNYATAWIDVSSEKLDVFLMNENEQGIHKIFENNKKWIQKIISWFNQKWLNKTNGKVVMESTWRYNELVAVILFAEGFNTYVINPLRIKKYTLANIRKVKTDKYDSRLIAEVALKEKYLDEFTLTKNQMIIKKQIAFIRSLEKKVQQLNGCLGNYEKSQKDLWYDLCDEENAIKDSVKVIVKKKEKLEMQVVTRVFKEDDKNNKNYNKAQETKNILTSISWISPYYAALMYFFYSINLWSNASSWIAFTWLEVSIAESWKWRWTWRLSKRWNRYLRKRNYTAWWWAMMHDEEFRKYYDSLRTKWRKHREALTILWRKVLRIAFSCLKHWKRFDSKVLEALNEENKINEILLKKMEN